MDKLIIKGLINIEGMKFHDIEGGFGKDKKAILVKDIAEIHSRELREINERINANIKRFNNGVDIVDLLGIDLTDTQIKEFGFSQQSINSYRGLKAKGQTTGIYLLSERGYAKLLKILEDDIAWEQYEKLVDGYFRMRTKTDGAKQLDPMEILELQFTALKETKQEVNNIKEDVKDIKENSPLYTVECKDLQALVKKIGIKALGGYKSPAYNDKSLRGRIYSDIQHQLRREFDVSRYEAIKRCQLAIARKLVEEYRVPTALANEISLANNQTSFEKDAM
jgi:hypothetical protein